MRICSFSSSSPFIFYFKKKIWGGGGRGQAVSAYRKDVGMCHARSFPVSCRLSHDRRVVGRVNTAFSSLLYPCSGSPPHTPPPLQLHPFSPPQPIAALVPPPPPPTTTTRETTMCFVQIASLSVLRHWWALPQFEYCSGSGIFCRCKMSVFALLRLHTNTLLLSPLSVGAEFLLHWSMHALQTQIYVCRSTQLRTGNSFSAKFSSTKPPHISAVANICSCRRAQLRFCRLMYISLNPQTTYCSKLEAAIKGGRQFRGFKVDYAAAKLLPVIVVVVLLAGCWGCGVGLVSIDSLPRF